MKYDCLWVCPSHLGTPLEQSQESSLRALGTGELGGTPGESSYERGPKREEWACWSGRTKCLAFVGTKRTRVSEEHGKSQAAGGAMGTCFRF